MMLLAAHHAATNHNTSYYLFLLPFAFELLVLWPSLHIGYRRAGRTRETMIGGVPNRAPGKPRPNWGWKLFGFLAFLVLANVVYLYIFSQWNPLLDELHYLNKSSHSGTGAIFPFLIVCAPVLCVIACWNLGNVARWQRIVFGQIPAILVVGICVVFAMLDVQFSQELITKVHIVF